MITPDIVIVKRMCKQNFLIKETVQNHIPIKSNTLKTPIQPRKQIQSNQFHTKLTTND